VRGDWVTPTLGGHTWFEKPALVYWAAMASYKVFGVVEWSARLGTLCAGLLTVLIMCWLAGRIETATGADWRGFKLSVTSVTATCAGVMVFARAVNFDIFVTCTIACALACFCLAELERDERRRRWWLAGFYAAMGAGLLAKGLVGVVLPIGVVGFYYLLRRCWPSLWLTLLWGGPLTFAVACLWYAPVIARNGWTFIDQFFIQQHFARYVSNKYHHPQPFYFYLPVLAALMLPWTAFLISALVNARRWRWRGDEPKDKLRIFALAWVVVPVAFFSLSGSKLPGYILPALPGAALLAGEPLLNYLRGTSERATMRATGLLLLFFAACLVGYVWRTRAVGMNCAALITTLPVLAACCALAWPQRRRLCAWGTVAAALGVVVLISACALATVARHNSVRDLLQQAAARGYANAPVYCLHEIERTAEFYAAGRLAYDAQGEPVKLEGVGEVMALARARGDALLIIVPVEYVWQLTSYPWLTAEVIGDNGANAFVAVR
ncbi:MAG TPA: glycosyltransferase family 39 protein, partial [Pyrinomonadaceae bacterium]|nr:glycosyltransferase family 39 protein [Pyrinomonadaceae bacterium]